MKTLSKIFITLVATLTVASGANNRQNITKELVSSSYSSGVTTLNWVIKYDTNTSSPLKDVVIKDVFSPNQTYTPNTEAHPNGWSVTQNPTGFTWEISDGLGYSKPFPGSNVNPNSDGNGDGFAPIPYTALNGDKRFYYTNHHKTHTYPVFGCIGACGNFNVPKLLPDGDPSSSDTTGTSGRPQTEIINRKLYYEVTRANDSGIGCYDLETNSECGYIKLSNLGRSSGAESAIGGLKKVGSSLYIMDGNGIVYRVNVASNGSMSSAGSYDSTTVGMTTNTLIMDNASNAKHYAISSDTSLTGNRIFFTKGDNSSVNRRLLCIDPISLNQCSGWSGAKVVPSLGKHGLDSFIHYNTSMVPDGICIGGSSLYGSQKCFDLSSGANITLSTPYNASSVQYLHGVEATVGTKTFFPSASTNKVFCYDWATASTCTPSVITKSGTKVYGAAIDDNQCLWIYGHNNILWSIDPQTGATPCAKDKMVLEDTYDASNNWCASKGVEWSYSEFKVTGITAGEFNDLNVTFYDANGNVISTQAIPTNGSPFSVNLAAAPFTPNMPIHYKIEGTRSNITNSNTPPVVTIGVDGPPREFCLQTTIPCPITGEVYNNATVSLKDAPAIDDRDEVVLDGELICKDSHPQPPKQCLNVEPKLTCTQAGWMVELNNFSPSNYSASNTDISVLSPSGVTATKWGNKWYINGANPGDTIRLSLHGADIGAGSLKDGDLCCDGDVNITIEQNQTCQPSYPEINEMKSYEDGIFKLHIGILGEIDAPQILTIIDRVPEGITITGIDPRSSSDWSCGNSFPVTGSANLTCTYIGSMPVSGEHDLYLSATIDSKESVTNCMDVGIIQSDGLSVYIDQQMASCVTVNNNQTEDNNTDNNNTGCQSDADCPDGYCHQGMCIVADNNNTDNGTDDNSTQPDGTPCDDNNASTINDIYVNGVCVGVPNDTLTGSDVPLTCNTNIIIVADESGSIAQAGATANVRNAIRNLVKGYKGHGSKAAVVHFANSADVPIPMTTIENAGVAPYQENYFTTGYNPTVGETNWEAGLKKALDVMVANPGPEVIFFITDGQPNKYLDANGNVQSGTEAQSVAQAVAVANQINSLGGRIVAIGVGDISNSANAQNNLNQIASSNDDAIVGQTNDLNTIIGEYITKSCSDILLRKTINYSSINLHNQDINTLKPIVTLQVTNSSPSPMTSIVIEDALPVPKMTYNSTTAAPTVGTITNIGNSKVRWTIPALAPNSSAIAQFKVNLSGVVKGDRIKNYAQVMSLDQSVASTPGNLANPITGPLNLSDKDEGYAEIRIYDYNSSDGEGNVCDPNTDSSHCIRVTKKMKLIEGNCMPGHSCVYDVTITNISSTTYTGNINLTDNMTPASLGANITVTANGNEPTPICSPNPTSVPFNCVQSTDLPANTTWSYTITMSSVPQGAVKNCFKAMDSTEACFPFPSPNRNKPIPDIPVVITPTKPDVKPKPVVDKPKPLIVVPRGNLSLYKRGPKVCKAGGICTFTLTVKNRGKGTYRGPVTIKDRSREFRGKLVKTRGKGWRCRTTRGGYVCNNPKLRLKAGATSKVVLSIRIPKRAKGYLTNCAKLDVLQGSNRIRAIQTMLLAAGYNIGRVNGSMNKRTIKALKAYAKANGIKGKKAQRVAIKRLLAKYPFIRSKNSCVKVKIKEYKPKCKRGQHFNGKQCVTCPRGSYWDKRHKRCVAKQVVKTCPRGYVLYKNRCYEQKRECPQGQEIDKRTGTCKRKLDTGTILNIINVVGHIIGGGGESKQDTPRDYNPKH